MSDPKKKKEAEEKTKQHEIEKRMKEKRGLEIKAKISKYDRYIKLRFLIFVLISRLKEDREYQQLVGNKTLADDAEDDVASWVTKSRNLQKEKDLAEKK